MKKANKLIWLIIWFAIRVNGAPVVITEGGYYSGVYTSDDPGTPAVSVATREKVVILNATIASVGDGISNQGRPGTDIVLWNCALIARNPGIAGYHKGRAVFDWMPGNLTVAYCTFEGWWMAVWAQNGSNPGPSVAAITIENNLVQQIDGRESDGKGGYLPSNWTTGSTDNDNYSGGLFIAGFQSDPNILIAWNAFVSSPPAAPGGAIGIYGSSGTSINPIRVELNLINGTFPGSLGQCLNTGICGVDTDLNSPYAGYEPAWVAFDANTVVNCAWIGMGLFYGPNNELSGDTIICSGQYGNGQWYSFGGYGAVIGGANTAGCSITNCVIGANDPVTKARNDVGYLGPVVQSSVTVTGVTSPHDGLITQQDEAAAAAVWWQSAASNNQQIGAVQ
jgi:hypothetical protein